MKVQCEDLLKKFATVDIRNIPRRPNFFF